MPNMTQHKSGWIAVAGKLLGFSAATFSAAGLLAGTPLAQTVPSNQDAPQPSWPKQVKAPAGAPNVLLILVDDVGFGATSPYGGPIPTPVFGELAKEGAQYNNFNATALCSPSRAALLTGRNPHNVGMGNVTNLPSPYPGYNSIIPDSAGTIADTLKKNGYSTAAFGKWHLTPEWEQTQVGPFDRWPTGMGFEYFYGFLGADASQWAPRMVRGTNLDNPLAPEMDHVLDKDLATDAVQWIQQQQAIAPDKPFFIYYALGTAHTPHHAPKEWLDRFKGKFDQGWDAVREETFKRQKEMGIIPKNARLTPRPEGLPAWSSLSADQKQVYARLMESYAAALSYSDAQIGRILDAIKQTGEEDNTLVVFLQGDNGGSAEGGLNGRLQQTRTPESDNIAYMKTRIDDIGGPKVYNHFPAGWGWGLNTPFQWYKQVASFFGGTRVGMVMKWPKSIPENGGIRDQFHFITDIMPTILEAANIKPAEVIDGVKQMPLDGISMAYTFKHPKEASHRKKQVFETMENFGIYLDGWFAGSIPERQAWELETKPTPPPGERKWALYNMREDFSQATNIAAQHPEKLKQLQDVFWQEAKQNNILPIHSAAIKSGYDNEPKLNSHRAEFTYVSKIIGIPESSAPNIENRSFRITANVDLPSQGTNGVIVSQGGRFRGYSLALIDGKPFFFYNAVPPMTFEIFGSKSLSAGAHEIEVVFDSSAPSDGGIARLYVDKTEVAQGTFSKRIKRMLSANENFDVGYDTITPVSERYASPAQFEGSIKSVTIRNNVANEASPGGD